MKRIALASILFMACGGSKKDPPKQPDPPAGDTPMAGDPASEKKMEAPAPPDTGGAKMITGVAAVTWAPLDPSNAAGPQLAVLHGDPKSGGAFFLKLPAGMKSGLHTHTADYHAVVVSGAPKHFLAGGDAKAKPLAAGSYWFQPGGQPHGDECSGKDDCVLYLVMTGGFDFTPTPKAKPDKAGAYKLVARGDMKFVPMDPKQPNGMKASFVFGNPAKPEPVGFVIEVPPKGNSGLHSHTSNYHALVIDGQPAHWQPHEANEGTPVDVGAYWYQPGGYDHGDRCLSDKPCRAFVFMEKMLDFKPGAAAKK